MKEDVRVQRSQILVNFFRGELKDIFFGHFDDIYQRIVNEIKIGE